VYYVDLECSFWYQNLCSDIGCEAVCTITGEPIDQYTREDMAKHPEFFCEFCNDHDMELKPLPKSHKYSKDTDVVLERMTKAIVDSSKSQCAEFFSECCTDDQVLKHMQMQPIMLFVKQCVQDNADAELDKDGREFISSFVRDMFGSSITEEQYIEAMKSRLGTLLSDNLIKIVHSTQDDYVHYIRTKRMENAAQSMALEGSSGFGAHVFEHISRILTTDKYYPTREERCAWLLSKIDQLYARLCLPLQQMSRCVFLNEDPIKSPQNRHQNTKRKPKHMFGQVVEQFDAADYDRQEEQDDDDDDEYCNHDSHGHGSRTALHDKGIVLSEWVYSCESKFSARIQKDNEFKNIVDMCVGFDSQLDGPSLMFVPCSLDGYDPSAYVFETYAGDDQGPDLQRCSSVGLKPILQEMHASLKMKAQNGAKMELNKEMKLKIKFKQTLAGKSQTTTFKYKVYDYKPPQCKNVVFLVEVPGEHEVAK
jgi:hypothetical protein